MEMHSVFSFVIRVPRDTIVAIVCSYIRSIFRQYIDDSHTKYSQTISILITNCARTMSKVGGGAEKPMDNDDNERAKGKQVAGASSSMNSGSSTGSSGGSGGQQTGGSTDAGIKNTANQSTGGEKSSTDGGSSSSGTGMFHSTSSSILADRNPFYFHFSRCW